MATPTTLPAAFVSGAVLTADQQNNLRGAFRVLQVVTFQIAAGVTATTSTYVATNLTATITPQSNTSKILVIANLADCVKENNSRLGAKLLRGATDLIVFMDQGGLTNTATLNNFGTSSVVYLDSPATTSATAYSVSIRSANNVASVYINYGGGSNSTIALFEISA